MRADLGIQLEPGVFRSAAPGESGLYGASDRDSGGNTHLQHLHLPRTIAEAQVHAEGTVGGRAAGARYPLSACRGTRYRGGNRTVGPGVGHRRGEFPVPRPAIAPWRIGYLHPNSSVILVFITYPRFCRAKRECPVGPGLAITSYSAGPKRRGNLATTPRSSSPSLTHWRFTRPQGVGWNQPSTHLNESSLSSVAPTSRGALSGK